MERRLEEFTVELETRPMASLQPAILDRLQREASQQRRMTDPVFALDESKGSILVICQVLAATAVLAVALGCWMFENMLVRSGIARSKAEIELVSVSKADDDKFRVQLPKEKPST